MQYFLNVIGHWVYSHVPQGASRLPNTLSVQPNARVETHGHLELECNAQHLPQLPTTVWWPLCFGKEWHEKLVSCHYVDRSVIDTQVASLVSIPLNPNILSHTMLHYMALPILPPHLLVAPLPHHNPMSKRLSSLYILSLLLPMNCRKKTHSNVNQISYRNPFEFLNPFHCWSILRFHCKNLIWGSVCRSQVLYAGSTVAKIPWASIWPRDPVVQQWQRSRVCSWHWHVVQALLTATKHDAKSSHQLHSAYQNIDGNICSVPNLYNNSHESQEMEICSAKWRSLFLTLISMATMSINPRLLAYSKACASTSGRVISELIRSSTDLPCPKRHASRSASSNASCWAPARCNKLSIM